MDIVEFVVVIHRPNEAGLLLPLVRQGFGLVNLTYLTLVLYSFNGENWRFISGMKPMLATTILPRTPLINYAHGIFLNHYSVLLQSPIVPRASELIHEQYMVFKGSHKFYNHQPLGW